jgi:hypothetical protein
MGMQKGALSNSITRARLSGRSEELSMGLAGTLLLPAICGLLWGGLAHVLEVAHSPGIAFVAGTAAGVLMGFIIKPLRDVEWPASAALSLVGLYVAVVLFAIGYSVVDLTLTSRPFSSWPPAIADACWAYVAGLSFSGYVFLLWPVSFANHVLVWWCQRRTATEPL